MDPRITLFDDVRLERPVLVAAWPGMGLVGLRTVNYLRDQFPARRLAAIAAGEFFRVPGVTVKDGVLDAVKVPASEFFAIRPAGADRDLVLFVGDEQPAAGKEFSFANLVVDVAAHFGVERIFTAAAMVTSLHHSKPSRVWAAATSAELIGELPADGYVTLTEGNIGGLNGLLLGVAHGRGIDGFCFLGEIPYYVTNLENPKASGVVLKLLATLLGFSLDFTALEQRAAYVESQIDHAVQQVKKDVSDSEAKASGADEAEAADDDPDHDVIN